eukprot:1054831-Prorocentrum_minimum.AAC.3
MPGGYYSSAGRLCAVPCPPVQYKAVDTNQQVLDDGSEHVFAYAHGYNKGKTPCILPAMCAARASIAAGPSFPGKRTCAEGPQVSFQEGSFRVLGL